MKSEVKCRPQLSNHDLPRPGSMHAAHLAVAVPSGEPVPVAVGLAENDGDCVMLMMPDGLGLADGVLMPVLLGLPLTVAVCVHV